MKGIDYALLALILLALGLAVRHVMAGSGGSAKGGCGGSCAFCQGCSSADHDLPRKGRDGD